MEQERKRSRTTKPDSRQGRYVIDGEVYACVACKRGHRVGKCDHANTRPLSATKPPGRPSGGDRRGCQCPRTCQCTTRTCSCPRDCTCVDTMYMVVVIQGGPGCGTETYQKGDPVTTDLQGNVLSPEEVQERKRREAERAQAVSSSPVTPTSSCCSTQTVPTKSIVLSAPPPALPLPAPPGQNCHHRENFDIAMTAQNSLTNSLSRDCSCGSTCGCAFCPMHPNNATSINLARQQFAQMAPGPLKLEDGGLIGTHGSSPMQSCLGGQPMFVLSRTPVESRSDLQRFMPSNFNVDGNSFLLNYPVSRQQWSHDEPLAIEPAQPYISTPMSAVTSPSAYNPTQSQYSPAADYAAGHWDMCGHVVNELHWTQNNSQTGMDFAFGNATIASLPDVRFFPVETNTSATPMSPHGLQPHFQAPLANPVTPGYYSSLNPFDAETNRPRPDFTSSPLGHPYIPPSG